MTTTLTQTNNSDFFRFLAQCNFVLSIGGNNIYLAPIVQGNGEPRGIETRESKEDEREPKTPQCLAQQSSVFLQVNAENAQMALQTVKQTPIQPQEKAQQLDQPFEAPQIQPTITAKTPRTHKEISNTLLALNIPPHIKGYSFMRDAIAKTISAPSLITKITKELYPSIARQYDTTASKVERAIRHAIDVCWARSKIETINQVFGIKQFSVHDKPTNGEFIALIADKLLLEGIKIA